MKRDGWTFLTNHGHVLVCLAQDQDALLRDVAVKIGITERAVQQIVADLERAGIIARLRRGRRNHYVVRRAEQLRHPLEAGATVGEFLDLVERGTTRRLAPGRQTVPEETSTVPSLRLIDGGPVQPPNATPDGQGVGT